MTPIDIARGVLSDMTDIRLDSRGKIEATSVSLNPVDIATLCEYSDDRRTLWGIPMLPDVDVAPGTWRVYA